MEGREFAKGDRVRDYHGRVMTVEDVYPPTRKFRYRCVWKGQDGDPKFDLFREKELTPEWSEPNR
jgi:hypothetical protein